MEKETLLEKFKFYLSKNGMFTEEELVKIAEEHFEPQIKTKNQMDKLEQENTLYKEFDRILEHFTMEYDMTYAQVLGVIKLIETDVIQRNQEALDDEDEE